ncbi:hypothetical protein E4T56_gene4670 [Termitomyces sp. T112]|nr:hypothetical protein E4T56_gene4670 [Termitomyces sp. T112]
MYIVPPDRLLSPEAVNIVYLAKQAVQWIIAVYLRETQKTVLPHVQREWPLRLAWENIIECLRPIFEHPERWPAHVFHAAKWFFVTHTHIVHLVSLSIFFGPIAVLIPLLFLHELVVSILFNLSFIFHGLLPGTVDDHYLYLSSIFDDLKGFTFSCVDRLGARYNKLTTESWCLLILRLFCLGLGSLALYHIVIEN